MSQKPRKLQRVSMACDFCNRRSIKCRQSEDPLGRCQNCVDFDVPCTFDRPSNRRGVKAGTRASGRDPQFVRTSVNHTNLTAAATASGRKASGSSTSRSPHRASISADPWSTFNHGWSAAEGDDDSGLLHNSWKAFAIACDRQIRNLVQIYSEIVYPIFPLFHMPSFIEQVNSKQHLCNQGLFASTMAACSLVAGRARDGALYSNRWDREELIDPPSEAFFIAARDSIPRDLVAAKGIHYMRACAILAIASIQNGQIKDMQKYSGLYHTLASMDGLYDEKLWPKDLRTVETEERRRLFWSIYTLDIYSTIVWGGVIRYREAHSLVRYPSEVDDEFITDRGYGVPSVSPGSNSLLTSNVTVVSRQPTPWMRGWNFTTDLYRILEHIVDRNRRRFSSANGTTQVWSLFNASSMSELAIMDQVLAMYSALPSQFRETPPTTGDMSKDLFGFQSANIQATLQLLRMLLLSTEEIGVERKCDVAGELLSVFSNVPIEYLKAISSPLLHHLGGIGYILGSVMEGDLSQVSYMRARTLLLEMADLLERLEMGSHRASGAGERLRSQVDRIDSYMRTSLLLDLTSSSDVTQVIDANPELAVTSAYTQGTDPVAASPGAGLDQMSQFQLPPELLSDWPWPMAYHNAEGFLPPAFE
ncbi:hypothetical protein ASPACDRAFT_82332 [Aspergillus aculeatus ATCC 16872]|uniref:Zn(2)-C6 fungal-type domain-containing protein n=1 Tax=Aspergillus aculeatus (strain ATCC 16872 / CBS 172.66 / WB 5094) TaxID=690307 RepID=A0A1L9WFA0_ASPA1|nr:uncharacterized protein ASPACDRAFT_82332 [Aspergillus aculeatus ATCC 16872]OJJ94860.1 hypothetical protein ASPACDRAFT_82332 [Aspergillus aculeatus ATCC 16872]